MHVTRSNRSDILATAIARALEAPGGDPLQPLTVAVSGRAAERWVSAHVAQRIGVAANVRWISPSTWLEETLARALGHPEETAAAWRASRLLWPVLALLGDHRGDARFAPVAFHLGDVAGGSARAVALARRIAVAFERYVTARPDMVREWDAGGGDGTDWQPVLWRALGARLGAPHLASLAAELERRLATGEPLQLSERVLWLTHASVPRLELDVLATLARHGVPVSLFVLSPSREAARRGRAFGEASGTRQPASPALLDLGHPLAGSLARQARDFEIVLGALGAERSSEDCYVVPEGDGILPVLQRGLLLGEAPQPGAPRAALVDGDESIVVHSCHGRMRQVEVLHDALLQLFDELPGLQPRDVTVLCGDVAAFAPLVSAVFSRPSSANGGGGPPAIPFRIADQPLRRENPVADVVLRALALAAARCDAAEVLDLLAVPLVARRFVLEDAERERIRGWVRDSGIRWGMDEAHREQHELPAERANSWRFGLDRMLLGTALPGGGRTLFGGVLPYDEIEGGDAELLGRFAEACERLFGLARGLCTPRPMAAWREALIEVVNLLVPEDDETAWPTHLFRTVLDSIAGEALAAGHDAPLDLAAIRLLVESHFAEESASSGFGSGAVTVCALRPGRTVPSRVVALLGMDDDVFPRRGRASGFDMLGREPLAGDPDPAADDRARFLEAVMAAKERLVITWTGRLAETNEPVPPAVPLGELLDAVAATYADDDDGRQRVRERLVRTHPLQPFSPAAFAGASPSSYAEAWLAGARRLTSERVPAPDFIARPLPAPPEGRDALIHLDDLARFLAEPAKGLLRERLRLSLEREDATVECREPASLDSLQEWALRARLLDALLDDQPTDALLALQRAAGVLPHGSVGELAFEDGMLEAGVIAQVVRLCQTEEPRDPVTIDLRFGDVRLVGLVGHIWGDVRLRWMPGTMRPKHLLEEWVRHLALQCALGGDAPGTAIVARAMQLTGSKSEKNVCRLGRVEDARARLERIVALYRAGLEGPQPWSPGASFAYACAAAKAGEADAGKALRAARKAWGPADVDETRTESDDAYAGRLHGDRGPMLARDDAEDPRFRELALEICAPVVAAHELETVR